ncbi:PREDICTED: mas-related G-protein coupled receptor member D-like [Elephantulus edwardii]|uniref:mas-related G-protein coupled receptor member D-like n=1 Tax=Elephantulus edwardii TaxID=28737 RepID=UPI0003F0E28E|nr:PREDICTED: mas-related G-protein coupled receptor member D-like [Elephantulus edwardii]
MNVSHLMENMEAYQVLQVLTLLTCVCGMVGNGVVIWLLGFRVQRNPFSVYVLNLAVADFLFLLFLFIKEYAEYFHLNWVTIAAFTGVMMFAYVTSLSFLTTISVQRCLSVLFPIWYKVRRPRHLSTVVCSLLWGLNLLVITIVSYFNFDEAYNHSEELKNLLTFLSILFLGVFTPVMILSSVVLSVQTLRRPRAWRRRSSRLCVIVLVSVLVFVVCSLPYGIDWTLMYRIPGELCWYHFLLDDLTQITSALSGSANPVIYFLVGSESGSSLWDPLTAILSRALQEDPELGRKEMSPARTNQTLNHSETADLTQRSPRMDAWHTAYHVVHILTFLTCVCGMVGNGVVIWLLGFRVQRNPFSVYVLNLAVADFLFLLGLFSKEYARHFHFNWVIIAAFSSVMACTYITSLSFLTTISVQRCLSILFPIWYKVRRPRHLSTVVYPEKTPCVAPAILRLFVIVLVSVLVFVVCSLPFGIFWTLMDRILEEFYWYYFLLYNLTQLTSALGSSANPVIYFLVGSESGNSLWDPLTAILSRALQEDPELGRKEMSPASTNDIGTESQEPMGSAQLSPSLD